MKLIPLFEAENKEILYHGSTQKFDKFDFDKIGSGDGLNKYGFGIYLTDNKNTAGKYTTAGKNAIVYKVKAYNVSSYAHWEKEIGEYGVTDQLLRKLVKYDDSYADQVEDLKEEWADWSVKNVYEWFADIIKPKEVSEWFAICGINGVVATNTVIGDVYVAFDDSELRILGVVGEDGDDDDDDDDDE